MTAAIIDSHPIFAHALSAFLRNWYQDIEVFRSSSVAMFDAQRRSLRPDFILLGVNHRFNSGEMMIFEAVRRTLKAVPIIIFYGELELISPFLKCGVSRFVAKNEPPTELQECINSVLSGSQSSGNEVTSE